MFASLIVSSISAQKVSNIDFEQRDKKMVITYNLEEGINIDSYDIKVFYSLDDGITWNGPLQYISSDVGENIKPGFSKTIIWDVLKETTKLTGNVKFQIKAKPHYKIDLISQRKYRDMFGFTFGLNIAKQVGYLNDYSIPHIGFNFGFIHRFNSNGIVSFQQEILFNRKGCNYSINYYTFNDGKTSTNYDYISIYPIILQINIRKSNPRIYPELGGTFEFLVNQKKIGNSFDYAELDEGELSSDDYVFFDTGIIAGLGCVFYLPKNCLTVNFRYYHGMMYIYWNDINGLYNKYNRCFSLNIGVLF